MGQKKKGGVSFRSFALEPPLYLAGRAGHGRAADTLIRCSPGSADGDAWDGSGVLRNGDDVCDDGLEHPAVGSCGPAHDGGDVGDEAWDATGSPQNRDAAPWAFAACQDEPFSDEPRLGEPWLTSLAAPSRV